MAAGSAPLAQLDLCEARLQMDARFPWIVLVPRRADLRELDALTDAEWLLLRSEIQTAGSAVRAIGEGLGRPVEKLNVGALGNIVPQLHIHIVGRRSGDAAWPGPVWGAGIAEPYTESGLERAIAAARHALTQHPD